MSDTFSDPDRSIIKAISDRSAPSSSLKAFPPPRLLQVQTPPPRYLALINALLLLPDGQLTQPTYLFVDTHTGLIISPNEAVASGTDIFDCGGGILSPGLIDIQINGAFGVDLSHWPGNAEEYIKGMEKMSRALCQMGVTSFVPTVITQKPEAYQTIIPCIESTVDHLNTSSDHHEWSTPLGVHLEGPFISPAKPGCHPPENLVTPKGGFKALENMYGIKALRNSRGGDAFRTPVKIVTIAPELPGSLEAISEVTERGFIASIGHTNATHEKAVQAVAHGATLITHLFNAMPALHHRTPGIIGLLGLPLESTTPGPSEAAKSHSVLPAPVSPMSPKSPLWSRVHSRVPSPVAELEEDYFTKGGLGLSDVLQYNADSDYPTALARPGSGGGTKRQPKRANGELKVDVEINDSPEDHQQPYTPLTPQSWKGVGFGGGSRKETEMNVKRPYFSIIADGIHVHPQAVAMAYNAHTTGCILVSDAMPIMDPWLKDGVYDWREGSRLEKKGSALVLEGTDTLAGSILPLPQAVRNLAQYAGVRLHQAILCATLSPAKVIGGWVEASKGKLEVGYDADLCLWNDDGEIVGVWKGGHRVNDSLVPKKMFGDECDGEVDWAELD